MLKKMKNKKGFTLAELLIVVAIIAILTAIAVPLFVGALNDATDNVEAANIRAVRGEAVAEILMDYNTYKLAEGEDGWNVTAELSGDGKIIRMTIGAAATTAKDTEADICRDYDAEEDTDVKDATNTKYIVKVWITETEVEKA